MRNIPKVDAIVPFIAEASSADWVRDQWILRDTLRSLLAIDENFLSITLVGHDFPEFTRNLKRVRLVRVDYSPPGVTDKAAKGGDSAIKSMYGLRDAFDRKVPWVFFMNADDFVSNRLPEFADLDNHDAVIITRGYSWEYGSPWLMRLPHFNRRCGSCNLIRCDESLHPVWLGGKSDGYLGDGNHNAVLDQMCAAGLRVQQPRHRLAVYRLGNHNNYWRKEASSRLADRFRGAAKFALRATRLTHQEIQEFSLPRARVTPASPPESI